MSCTSLISEYRYVSDQQRLTLGYLSHPEHTLVTISFKRLIAALAIILPAAALVTSPVMAASQTKTKHHVSIHKASHKTTHAKKATTPTAS
jgi:hypothetical protein